MKTKDMARCAMMSAFICVCSVISIPLGTISITLSVLGVLLAGIALGGKRGAISTAVYVLLGAVGLPVFGGMGISGGLGYILGPAGGYVFSYVLMALMVGIAADKLFASKSRFCGVGIFLSCLAAVTLCYILGTLRFMAVTGTDLASAAATCVVCFIPFDILKCLAATLVGIRLRKIVG